MLPHVDLKTERRTRQGKSGSWHFQQGQNTSVSAAYVTRSHNGQPWPNVLKGQLLPSRTSTAVVLHLVLATLRLLIRPLKLRWKSWPAEVNTQTPSGLPRPVVGGLWGLGMEFSSGPQRACPLLSGRDWSLCRIFHVYWHLPELFYSSLLLFDPTVSWSLLIQHADYMCTRFSFKSKTHKDSVM